MNFRVHYTFFIISPPNFCNFSISSISRPVSIISLLVPLISPPISITSLPYFILSPTISIISLHGNFSPSIHIYLLTYFFFFFSAQNGDPVRPRGFGSAVSRCQRRPRGVAARRPCVWRERAVGERTGFFRVLRHSLRQASPGQAQAQGTGGRKEGERKKEKKRGRGTRKKKVR